MLWKWLNKLKFDVRKKAKRLLELRLQSTVTSYDEEKFLQLSPNFCHSTCWSCPRKINRKRTFEFLLRQQISDFIAKIPLDCSSYLVDAAIWVYPDDMFNNRSIVGGKLPDRKDITTAVIGKADATN